MRHSIWKEKGARRMAAALLAAVLVFASAPGLAAQAADDAADTADEFWYTKLGDCQTYYGALRDFDGEIYPAIRVLSYTGDMIEMRTDWLNFLNDYGLEPASRTETEWVYPGVGWPDDLTYYPADGSIGIQEGDRVDVYQPMLEHGPQYALPEELEEDWYWNVGEMTYATDDEYIEVGLMFTDGGDGSFTAMMLPVDEYSFQTDACEGTPAGGVYYPGDRAELYYYPEYGAM